MRIVVLLAFVLCPAVAVQEQDERLDNWHQFRGPTGNGVAPRGKPPTEWSEEKNIKWKVEIPGRGSATPIIWKDRVFVLTAIDTKKRPEGEGDKEENPGGRRRRGARTPKTIHQFIVLCLDRKSGKVLWKKVAHEQKPHEGAFADATYASPTPATDGKYLYASFGSYGVYCYDFDGELKWKRDLGDLKIEDQFGEGISPVIHGDSLIHLWDHEEQSYLYCLDTKTGKDRWKVKRSEPTTWQTPLIVDHDGVTQVIVNGKERSMGYDLKTGKVLWKCGSMSSSPLPSPVAGEGVVYLMTGYRKYAINAVSLSARGDVTGKKELLWSRKDQAPYVSSPLLYDGLLYITIFSNGILSCIDAKTGKSHYDQERLTGIRAIYASLAGADGRVYVVGRRGTMLVLRHGKEFKILATNRLEDGFDASPVIAGKQLFLRGKRYLYCVAEE